jgi:hypothetical protein
MKAPDDLNKLEEIPAKDIQSGYMPQCWGDHGEEGCDEPVKYRMTIEEWPEGEGYYSTAYWCEKHKPQD